MSSSSKTRGTIDRHLNASKRERSIVRIEPFHAGSNRIDGIVLVNRESFVALQVIEDFEDDGAAVIPKGTVESVRRGPFERCATAVYQKTPTRREAKRFKWLTTLRTLPDVVRYLQAHDLWPAVKIADEDETIVYVGKVTKLSDASFAMWCYDAAGEWEREYEVEYDEVIKVEIDSRYLRHFNRYMKRKGLPR
jgi:hypothetical protein